MGLTQRQAACLASIRTYIAAHGRSPTYAEIAAALGGGSKSTVTRLLRALKQRGRIDFTRCASRSITLRADPACDGGWSGWGLPADLQARLDALCAQTGDDPASVIADAVALHIDAFDEADDADMLALFGAAFDGGAS